MWSSLSLIHVRQFYPTFFFGCCSEKKKEKEGGEREGIVSWGREKEERGKGSESGRVRVGVRKLTRRGQEEGEE